MVARSNPADRRLLDRHEIGDSMSRSGPRAVEYTPIRRFADRCFTHDIENLVVAADLQAARGQAIATNPALGTNWQVVKDWNMDCRYEEKSEADARDLYDAVTDAKNAVLTWIKAHW
jgi:hypothetical protein